MLLYLPDRTAACVDARESYFREFTYAEQEKLGIFLKQRRRAVPWRNNRGIAPPRRDECSG
jgi:hypothetical protein